MKAFTTEFTYDKNFKWNGEVILKYGDHVETGFTFQLSKEGTTHNDLVELIAEILLKRKVFETILDFNIACGNLWDLIKVLRKESGGLQGLYAVLSDNLTSTKIKDY